MQMFSEAQVIAKTRGRDGPEVSGEQLRTLGRWIPGPG